MQLANTRKSNIMGSAKKLIWTGRTATVTLLDRAFFRNVIQPKKNLDAT